MWGEQGQSRTMHTLLYAKRGEGDERRLSEQMKSGGVRVGPLHAHGSGGRSKPLRILIHARRRGQSEASLPAYKIGGVRVRSPHAPCKRLQFEGVQVRSLHAHANACRSEGSESGLFTRMRGHARTSKRSEQGLPTHVGSEVRPLITHAKWRGPSEAFPPAQQAEGADCGQFAHKISSSQYFKQSLTLAGSCQR